MTGTAAPKPGPIARLRDMPAIHGVLLALFALVTALLLAVSDDLTRGPIAARAAEDLAASLAQVVPDALHDNALGAAALTLDDAGTPVTVYRGTLSGAVTAIAFERVGYGYSGAIRVLMAVDADGAILGVRVLAHAETPGLGDKIETAKGDWILGFDGLSLGNPPPERWKVKRDGGQFDQFSGATITPRAVVGAIREGLDFFAAHRAELTAIEGAM